MRLARVPSTLAAMPFITSLADSSVLEVVHNFKLLPSAVLPVSTGEKRDILASPMAAWNVG